MLTLGLQATSRYNDGPQQVDRGAVRMSHVVSDTLRGLNYADGVTSLVDLDDYKASISALAARKHGFQPHKINGDFVIVFHVGASALTHLTMHIHPAVIGEDQVDALRKMVRDVTGQPFEGRIDFLNWTVFLDKGYNSYAAAHFLAQIGATAFGPTPRSATKDNFAVFDNKRGEKPTIHKNRGNCDVRLIAVLCTRGRGPSHRLQTTSPVQPTPTAADQPPIASPRVPPHRPAAPCQDRLRLRNLRQEDDNRRGWQEILPAGSWLSNPQPQRVFPRRSTCLLAGAVHIHHRSATGPQGPDSTPLQPLPDRRR